MAWRFKKQSKFKNSAPKILRKEDWLTDLPIGALMQTHGNHIKSSCSHIAFNTNHAGGAVIGILPLQSSGRQSENVKLISAHSDLVTDFDFSPFNDGLLASCSQDNSIRLWLIPEDGLLENLSTPVVSLDNQRRRVDTVLWHPKAEGILASTMDDTIKLFDISTSQEIFTSSDHGDLIQGMSWRSSGSTIATCCKDTILRVWDPRAGASIEGKGQENPRDSRVVWIGDSDLILSTGFDNTRQRRVGVWDCRNLSSSIENCVVDQSTGILMPFFDADTNMLLMIGKGDSMAQFFEISDSSPYLTQCASDRIDQAKGAASVPKRALDVMKGEVMRLLLLTKNHIIPVPYIVPRKTYRDFHPEIFPDTFSMEPTMKASDWLSGLNCEGRTVGLDPQLAPAIEYNRGSLFPSEKKTVSASVSSTVERDCLDPQPQRPATDSFSRPEPQIKPLVSNFMSPVAHDDSDRSGEVLSSYKKTPAPNSKSYVAHEEKENKKVEKTVSNPTPRRGFAGVRKSRFRYLKGTILHKNLHFTNLRKVGKTVPGECDMFHANSTFCAFPLDGPGGLVAVINLSKPGKLPDLGLPSVSNGSKVCDFAWDPFDDCRLFVGCDDARIRIWEFGSEGPEGTITDPVSYLTGHREKIYAIKPHPYAKNVLASSSYDHKIILWNVDSKQIMITLEGHTENILSFGWSRDGCRCATVSKDGKIRVYDPRKSTQPLQIGKGPAGPRGARIIWVLEDKYLVVTGFTRSAERLVSVYNFSDLSKPLHTITVDTSPAILIPFYDTDCSVILMTGRGDGTVFAYEISEDNPHLFELCHYKGEGLHQAMAYQPKRNCDVTIVEFAKALKLTANSIEPISFTIPRVKIEFFQDDVFPDTRPTWVPGLSSLEWFSGLDRLPDKINLCPESMQPLSRSHNPVKENPRHIEIQPIETTKTVEEKKEELFAAWNSKLEFHQGPLEQDFMEGVDASEWDD